MQCGCGDPSAIEIGRNLSMRILKTAFAAVLALVVVFTNFPQISVAPVAKATVAGQMKLYFHKEPSDKNEALNSMNFTSPEPAADTASLATSTTTFSSAS